MRVKSNNKIYDVLEFTNDKEVIEKFAGEGSICRTRINGVGFTSQHEYAVLTKSDSFWFSPDTVMLKNSKGEIFWMTMESFKEFFGRNNK